jgi:hypothetical protein
MPPLADFVCNSKRCRTKKGEAPVYELPIKATHCPMGHKQIVRLYNRIAILKGSRRDDFDGRRTSSSKARRLDAIIEQPMVDSLAKRDELKQALRPGERWRGDMGIVKPVPVGRIAGALQQEFGPGAPLLPAAPVHKGTREERLIAARSGRKSGVVAALEGAAPPTTIAARDTEYRVVRGKDGLPEAARG